MNPTSIPSKNSFAPQTRALINTIADRLLPKSKTARKAIQCTVAGGILAMTSIQGFAAFSYDVVDFGVIPFDPSALLNTHCYTDNGLLVVGYGDSTLYDLNSANPLQGHQLIAPTEYSYVRVEAIGMNASGQIVGTGWTNGGSLRQAIVWDSPTSVGRIPTAYAWNDTYAFGINNAGIVALDFNNNAAYWNTNTGAIAYLPKLPGNGQLLAIGINNRGQIVGGGTTDELGGWGVEAFIWDAENGTRGIGTLGGTTSNASYINEKGQILGRSQTGTGETHAFIWEEEKGMTDLGAILECHLNDAGVVVGNMNSGDHKGVIWDAEGGMRQISDLADLSDYYMTNAVSINNEGEVLVQAYKNGEFHLLKLTAVPEPSTYAALGGLVLSGAILVSRRKKRTA